MLRGITIWVHDRRSLSALLLLGMMLFSTHLLASLVTTPRVFVNPPVIQPNANGVIEFSIMAENIPPPGLFGYSLVVNLEGPNVNLIEGQVVSSAAPADKVSCSVKLLDAGANLLDLGAAVLLDSGQGALMLGSSILCAANGLVAGVPAFGCLIEPRPALGNAQTGNGALIDFLCFKGADVPNGTIPVILETKDASPIVLVDNTGPATTLEHGQIIIGALPPVIVGTLFGWDEQVSGTSDEPAGTQVKVFVNGTEAGDTTVQGDGTWTAALTAPLEEDDQVTAQSANSAVSDPVTVQANVVDPPAINAPIAAGTDTVSGTSNEAPGRIVKVLVNGVEAGEGEVQGDHAWSVVLAQPLQEADSVTAQSDHSDLSGPVVVGPRVVGSDDFLCYSIKESRGDICRAGDSAGAACDRKKNAAVCGDETLCLKNKFPKGVQALLKRRSDAEPLGFDVQKPEVLCNPANEVYAEIADKRTHLKGYKIKPFSKFCKAGSPNSNDYQACKNDQSCGGERRSGWCVKAEKEQKRKITVKDRIQPEPFVLETNKPDRLLVPTAKDHDRPIDPPDPADHSVNHFKCWTVKQIEPKFPKGLNAFAAEQFSLIPGAPDDPTKVAKGFEVKGPKRLCFPVDKNDEGIDDPARPLICYSVKELKGVCSSDDSPENAMGACRNDGDCGGNRREKNLCVLQSKHAPVLGLHVNNQFGPELLDTKKEEELCIVPDEVAEDR